MSKVTSHTAWENRSIESWRRLIDRYFEAETTEEEERQLRLFLQTKEAEDEEFDEIKAVMGFLVTGKALQNPEKRKGVRFPAVRWVAAAVFFLLAGGAAWQAIDRRQNICVAYIYGKKCTDTHEVMSQLRLSFCQVQHGEEDVTVESQLNDIFQTLEDGGVTTNQ